MHSAVTGVLTLDPLAVTGRAKAWDGESARVGWLSFDRGSGEPHISQAGSDAWLAKVQRGQVVSAGGVDVGTIPPVAEDVDAVEKLFPRCFGCEERCVAPAIAALSTVAIGGLIPHA